MGAMPRAQTCSTAASGIFLHTLRSSATIWSAGADRATQLSRRACVPERRHGAVVGRGIPNTTRGFVHGDLPPSFPPRCGHPVAFVHKSTTCGSLARQIRPWDPVKASTICFAALHSHVTTAILVGRDWPLWKTLWELLFSTEERNLGVRHHIGCQESTILAHAVSRIMVHIGSRRAVQVACRGWMLKVCVLCIAAIDCAVYCVVLVCVCDSELFACPKHFS